MLTTHVAASNLSLVGDGMAGMVGLTLRSWVMRVARMGLAASSGADSPSPTTSNSLVLLSFPLSLERLVARASSSGGKWLIHEEQKSRIRPLRGSVWA